MHSIPLQVLLFDDTAGDLMLPIYFKRRVRNLFSHPQVKRLASSSRLKIYSLELFGDCCWNVYSRKFTRGTKTTLKKGHRGGIPEGGVESFEKIKCAN